MRIPVFAKYIVGTALALTVLYFVGDYVLVGSMCGNQVISETKSPDGSFEAVVFQRDCGATTGFSTQVSIFRSWLPRGSSSGNVFVSDTNRGAAPAGIGGGPEISVNWQSSNELVISHHPKVRIYLSEPQWGSVKVKYEDVTL